MAFSAPSRDPTLVRLPLELIPHIFHQLDPQQDKVTLTNCALIAPCFQTAAQAHLFSSVTLYYVIGYDKEYKLAAMDMPVGLKFLRSITESRRLASHVRKLEIQLSDNTVASSNMKAANDPTFSSLDAILSTLTRLKTFVLNSNRSIYWGTISDTHKSSIANVLRANDIQDLRILCTSHFPPSLCCHSSTLTDLIISSIDDQNDVVDRNTREPRSIALKALTIGWQAYGLGIIASITQFLENSACPLDISNLASLEIATSYAEPWHISPILDLCSNTLTRLTMMVPEEAGNKASFPIVNLNMLRNLSELHLSGCITSRWLGSHRSPVETLSSPVTWIGNVLNTLPFDRTSTKFPDPYLQIDLNFVQVSAISVSAVLWDELVAGILCHSSLHRKVVNILFTDYFLPQYAKPHGPGMFKERIRILKEDANLQRLGEDVVFDYTERFTIPRTHPSLIY